jgi:hypothetical protein
MRQKQRFESEHFVTRFDYGGVKVRLVGVNPHNSAAPVMIQSLDSGRIYKANAIRVRAAIGASVGGAA